jgi:tetratricopeptide (TPR) repeat protein
LNPVTLRNLLHLWANPYESEYIPLSYTVWGGLALIARVSPDPQGITLNPYVFHCANLVVHLAAVLVAFQLLWRLTGRRWPAAAGALLFALHPIQVESVAWVTGLKDVLCGLLSLFALWQYLLFAPPAGDQAPLRTNRMRAAHYGIATLAFILALLAKPSAVTIPLLAWLLDRLFLRRNWRQSAKALAPWLGLSIAFSVAALAAHSVEVPADGGRTWARPLLAGAALAFYLYKVVWPFRFAVIYHYSPQLLLAGHWIWFAWMVPIAITIFLWIHRKRWPWLVAGAAWSLVATLPVLGLTPFQFQEHSLVADRYFYVAMIGPALVLSYALAAARHKTIPAVLATACLLALGIRSYLQTAHWHDTVTLFTHELTVNPASAEAYDSLGVQAMVRREPQLAEHLARESIRLQPRQNDAYVTLAAALVGQGRTQDAIPLLLFVYDHDPDDPSVLTELGSLLAAQASTDPRKLAEAARLCRRALEVDPLNGAAHDNLATILARQSYFQKALREAQRSVQINPGDAHAQTTLARILEHEHQHDLAIQHAMQAVQLDPGNVLARQLLDDLTRPPR